MSAGPRRAAGCAAGVILSVVLVISFVGWALSFMDGKTPIRQYQTIPSDVPPAVAEAVPDINVNTEGRTGEKLKFWAEPLAADTGISVAALQAYGNAQLIAEASWPECHLSWGTLAGLGWVETRHGTYSGERFQSRKIDAEGYVLPPIIGVPLDGSPGFAEVKDTDNGELDGDSEHDRAVGPLQFIPESWGKYGRDANGDGKADPNQIDDAAVGAANLLCAGGRDLATPEGWTEAIHSYNSSNEYLIKVRNAAANYALRQPA